MGPRCKTKARSALVLEILVLAGMGLSVDDIAESFGMDRDRIIHAIDQLEREGHIEPMDSISYVPTKKGIGYALRD